MIMLWLELKKYIYNIKLVLFCFVSFCLLGGLVLFTANKLTARQRLFEPFSIGVVDYDNSMESNLLISMFNKQEEVNETLALTKLSREEAQNKLLSGEIPAYLEIPSQFAEDIKVGRNSPFKLYGLSGQPSLQFAVSRLLSKAGIAFLSHSQAGIYATLDYAYENGLPSQTINDEIVLPINLQFVARLLQYQDFLTEEKLSLFSGLSPVEYYVYGFSVYLLLLGAIVLIRILKDSWNPGIAARFHTAGFSTANVQGLRLFGLFTVSLVCISPLAYLLGCKIIFIALSVAAFALFASNAFESQISCGLFLFIASSIMMLISGAIVPLAFLPEAFQTLKYFTIPHWVIQLSSNRWAMAALFGFSLIFFLLSVYFAGSGKENSSL